MTSCYDNQDYDRESNSGFIFGLICGLVIGAVVAIIIYKKNKTDIFEKLSQQIKGFFENLTKTETKKGNLSKKKSSSKKKLPQKIFSTSTLASSKSEITPVFVKSPKPAPKTFIKPKK